MQSQDKNVSNTSDVDSSWYSDYYIYYVYFGERLIANYECEKNNSSITNNNNLPLGWMVEIATNNNPAHCNK